eukprot:scaffold122050_cov52-Attheya_sp.AAC.2
MSLTQSQLSHALTPMPYKQESQQLSMQQEYPEFLITNKNCSSRKPMFGAKLFIASIGYTPANLISVAWNEVDMLGSEPWLRNAVAASA